MLEIPKFDLHAIDDRAKVAGAHSLQRHRLDDLFAQLCGAAHSAAPLLLEPRLHVVEAVFSILFEARTRTQQ